ncbi:glycoside hydrolase family 19 protein [Mesorhizobium amorphae]|uniref:glycoside hydrolase family 19 protein n=1 Tax=Mesorhizobium amorphae TaxID=71433 RepID=UPI00164291DD|nr:glycoside hydrolase family 19 protein [Mesorhizobium amorphae]
MDRSRFYASVRARTSGVLGTSLSQAQVDGIEVVLDAGQNAGLPLRHLACVLATAYHETGGKMQPVNENLNYTSAARIRQVWPARFTSNAAAIPYVRNPQGLANRVYANRMGNGSESSGDGWRYRGRALPQITGRENYTKASRLVGVDLIANPDRANDSAISARILIEGMRSGMFTGKRLSDYIAGDRVDYVGARAIINGDVGANGERVAGYAKAFEAALREAGYIGQAPKTLPTPATPTITMPDDRIMRAPAPPTGALPTVSSDPQPTATPSAKRGLWAILDIIFPRKGA